MRCPFCENPRGRPVEYEIPHLMEHVLDQHPAQALDMLRGIVKSEAIGGTDVVWKSDSDGS